MGHSLPFEKSPVKRRGWEKDKRRHVKDSKKNKTATCEVNPQKQDPKSRQTQKKENGRE